MVYRQISAQTRSLHTDQNPISTIFIPKPKTNDAQMATQLHNSIELSATTFATKLRQRRLRLKLSLAELAERVGCAKSYISSIENGHKGPPADSLIENLEQALSFQSGELFDCARWDQTPILIKQDIERLRERDYSARSLARFLSANARSGASLDELYASGELRNLIDQIDPASDTSTESAQVVHTATDEECERVIDQESSDKDKSMQRMMSVLPMEVPVINKVTAGYPADFSDMGYPARTADEYIRTPDLNDPDAFAARVVGDSMEPNYCEGDIVVFSPAREISDGMDCFVRLEPDHDSTFKRIYFQTDDAGNELIRIQPINNRYPPMTVPREEVAGLYAGVSVTRSIG
ncbi:MAG: LexA family transcriptional regulator [Phycisphaerales bacterium]|nr:LexA family transcriptional regulator [Phycisphaerales bacterium]